MKSIKFIFLSVLLSLTFISCSSGDNSDDPENQEQIQLGGEIFTFQMMEIYAENVTQDSYNASFNGEPIIVAHDQESQVLKFFVDPVSSNIDTEDNILEIPALDIKIKYTVRETVLQNTVEETMMPYFDLLDNVNTEEDSQGQNIQAFLDGVGEYYNSLSEEEKHDIAKFHQANVDMFAYAYDSLRTNDFPYTELVNCGTSAGILVTFGTSAVLLSKVRNKRFQAIALGAAIGALPSAVKNCQDFASELVKHFFANFDGLESSRSSTNNNLVFIDETPKSVSAINAMRSLQTSDEGDPNENINNFFASVALVNGYINTQFNTLIEWYNASIPTFFNVEPFENPINIPENGSEASLPMENYMYENFSFNVGHEDVSIIAQTFSNGAIEFTMKIAEDSEEQEIETSLNYTYNDLFNTGESRAFPIVVKARSLVGTWNMDTFYNDVPVGEYDDIYTNDCPNIVDAIETMTGSFTFNGDETFSYVWNTTQIAYNTQYNSDCEVTGDQPNVTYQDTETGTGTYSFNGTNYILDYNEGGTETVQILEPDRIKVYQEEYVRQ